MKKKYGKFCVFVLLMFALSLQGAFAGVIVIKVVPLVQQILQTQQQQPQSQPQSQVTFQNTQGFQITPGPSGPDGPTVMASIMQQLQPSPFAALNKNLTVKNTNLLIQIAPQPDMALTKNSDGSFTFDKIQAEPQKQTESKPAESEPNPHLILDHREELELSQNQLIGINQTLYDFDRKRISAAECASRILAMLGPWQQKTWKEMQSKNSN